MALLPVPAKPAEGALPARVAKFIRAADARIDAFQAQRVKRPLHSFVPSDLEPTWRMLETIRRDRLAAGTAFCEWGCGFAAVAGLATLAGFDACAIEIERDLYDEARRLADDFALKITLARGSFVPQDAGPLGESSDELPWLADGGPDGHAILRRDPDQFDLVFAYPWPGEEEVIYRLFDDYAAPGALLLTFHGEGELRLHRKPSRE